MAAITHIHVRAARDRLIELLNVNRSDPLVGQTHPLIGQPYPLQDLAVGTQQLMVAFNTSAKIPIANSQQGVLYQLHYKHVLVTRTAQGEKGAGIPIEAAGDGTTIWLETYKIQEDITFEIFAQKQSSGRAAYLHQTATVKVGLDTKLVAQILDAPYLDPASTGPTAPRLVDYGKAVQVEIQNSQEGVDYRLVKPSASGQPSEEVILSVKDERGILRSIVLVTQPIYEDTDLHIRATRTFDPSENLPLQTALLDVVLPLKVRANPALAVAVDPLPIINFQTAPILKIASTQRTVRYRVFMHPLSDQEFVRQAVPPAEVITVSVDGEVAVQVRQPARSESWVTPQGYAAVGEAQTGTGGELALQLPALTNDSLLIVQAQKDHQAAQVVSSAIQLAQAALVLVRPNQTPPLRVKVQMDGAVTNGDLAVFDGQPGVFYYFYLDSAEQARWQPAYFHKRDEHDAQYNKGLGQLAVEVDFVIACPPPAVLAGADLAKVPPAPPIVTTGRLPADSRLQVRAVKAQTRVAALLESAALIPAGPDVEPEDAMVDAGATTRIRIKASRAKEWYQLVVDGNPYGEAVKGTGQDRLLATGPLTMDTTITLLIRSDDPIMVERVLGLTVQVRLAVPRSVRIKPGRDKL